MTHLLILIAPFLLGGAVHAASLAPSQAPRFDTAVPAQARFALPAAPLSDDRPNDITRAAPQPFKAAPTALSGGPVLAGPLPPPYHPDITYRDPHAPAGPLPHPYLDDTVIPNPVPPSLLGAASALSALLLLRRRRR